VISTLRHRLAWALAVTLGAVFAGAALAQPARAPDLILTGVLTGAQHQTYTEVPFKLPAGVERITVDFTYTGKDERSVIDLGLRDPERFRGWSGGNKSRFTLAESDATPSYLPGRLKPGTWKLVLGAPNIRKAARATYEARIWFGRKGEPPEPFSPAIGVAIGEAWWRGDLHVHTGHSDGSCLSRRGVKIPCPVFKTLDAAVARGLDFVAVTDHNTTSQFEALRELAPYYDDLLIIAGREVTTFKGHANLFGPTSFVDFQLGGPRAPDFGAILDEAEAAGGLVALNHPGLPSGEFCMGCGWTAPDTDYGRIAAIEVVNGVIAEGPLSGVGFWEKRLDEGHRITAIGGSDNHDPTLDIGKAPSLGVPTTVVRSPILSQGAILQAIRAGHVFIDVQGGGDRILEVTANADGAEARMGDGLVAPAGTRVELAVHVANVPGGRLSLSGSAARAVTGDLGLQAADETRRLAFVADGSRQWLRVDVRDAGGKLVLLGNPIYLNFRP
jgi:predicted metal-dependent phosphoesterase TrpH